MSKKVKANSGQELSVEGLEAIGHLMGKTFAQYKNDRGPQEAQWIKNLRQFLGQYDPEILSTIEPTRSKAYPKLTRSKIMVIVARLMNLLFPQGDKNWMIRASNNPNLTPEELDAAFGEWASENPEKEVTQEELDSLVRAFATSAATELEGHIADQLGDAMGGVTENDSDDFVALCRRVIISAAVFNCGVLKGPMTLSVTHSRPVVVPGSRPRVETSNDSRPYFDYVDLWDYYPDLRAKRFSDMDGQFEAHVYAKHQMQALAERDDFIGENIRKVLHESPEGNFVAENHETELDTIGGKKDESKKSGKYRVIEYWGSVPTKMLKAAGVEMMPEPTPDVEGDAEEPGGSVAAREEETGEQQDTEDHSVTRAVVWFIGNTVIKAEVDPMPGHVDVYHHFVFDDTQPNLLGGSMAQILRDSQMAVASSARMLIDNASVVCGPNLEIDLSKLVDGVAPPAIGAFQNFYVDGRNNPGGHRAVNSISFDSHINELLSVMNQFMSFADMETFVRDDTDAENTPGEALRTQGGASMILGNAALPFRDIVRSFDRFTVSVLNALVEWNRIFNADIAIMGDLRPVARGATSLIAKEVKAYALDSLAQTMTEDEALYIDEDKLVQQRFLSRDIPLHDVMADEGMVKRRKEQREERAQLQQQREQELHDLAVRERNADVMKNLAQARKNLDTADAAAAKVVATLMETGAKIDESARGVNAAPGEAPRRLPRTV